MVVEIIRNGVKFYVHTAWANDTSGTDFSLTEYEEALFVGNYIDRSSAESNLPVKYTWKEIHKDDGENVSATEDGLTDYEERMSDLEASTRMNADDLTGTQQSTDSAIGNSNLLLNTNNGTTNYSVTTGYSIEEVVDSIGEDTEYIKCVKITCNTPSTSGMLFFNADSLRDVLGSAVDENTYTLSMHTKMSQLFDIDVLAVQNSNGDKKQLVYDVLSNDPEDEDIILDDEWVFYESTTQYTEEAADNQMLCMSLANMPKGAYLVIANLKIEAGAVATQWKESVEEVSREVKVIHEKVIITEAEVSRVSGEFADFKSGEFNTLKSDQAEFKEATIIDLRAVNAALTSVSGELASFKTGEFETLKAGVAEIEKAYIKAADVNKLLASYATIENLNATNASITTLTAKAITTDNLSAKVGEFGYITAEEVKANYVSTQTLEADYIKATDITAKYATIDLANVKDGSIKQAMIGTGVVGTAQIADSSITDAKIVELTANKINAGTLSVERLEIRGTSNSIVYALNNITGALQAQNVDTLNGEILTPRTITADKIVANAITANEIASKTITANEILAGTITATEIASNTITANEIAAGTITATEIKSGAITAEKIDVENLFAQEIAATGTITGATLYGAYIEAGAGMIGPFTINSREGFSSSIFNDVDAVQTDVNLWGKSQHYNTNGTYYTSDTYSIIEYGLKSGDPIEGWRCETDTCFGAIFDGASGFKTLIYNSRGGHILLDEGIGLIGDVHVTGNIEATNFLGTASKAIADANGNNIVDTYATKGDISAAVGGNYLPIKGLLGSYANTANNGVTAGLYTLNNSSTTGLPATGLYGAFFQLPGDYKPQMVIGGTDGEGTIYVRRYLTGSSSWTAWARMATTADLGEYALKDHTHSGYAASSHTHTKSQITDFPTSMPASDVYAWAKASSKPSYTYSEVGAAAAGHTHADYSLTTHTHSDYATTSQLSSYLPLSGGTLTGPLTVGTGTDAAYISADGMFCSGSYAAFYEDGNFAYIDGSPTANAGIRIGPHSDYLGGGTVGIYNTKTGRYEEVSVAGHTHTYLSIFGGMLEGSLKFQSSSLPQKNLEYICGIDAFAAGGEMGWQSKGEFLAGYATTSYVDSKVASVGGGSSEYPAGFASRTTGAPWGNTIGTSFTCWNDPTGGSIDFRQDNPSAGKVSIKVDGRVYVNEGLNPVMGMESANGYWGMCTPDGVNSDWIRTSTLGIIPYQAGGHGSIGTSTWPFSVAYVNTIYEGGTALSSKYLALSGGTMSGPLRVNDYIFGYRYAKSNNAPAFVFDKPGSYYTGIGANGAADTILFAPVSSDGNFNWVSDYNQIWKFQGSLIATGALSLGGALTFANNTMNTVGDDVQIGDQNVAGTLCVKGVNGTTAIQFMPYNSNSVTAKLMSNDVSSYGGLRVTGLKNSYHGILFGDDNTGMHVMSCEPHQGLYNESRGRWILYYNRTYDQIGIGTAPTTESGYKLQVYGATLISGNLTASGLRASSVENYGTTAVRIATLDGNGWLSYRTPAEIRSDISAAASSHSHSYLPLSGGTLTGTLIAPVYKSDSTDAAIKPSDSNEVNFGSNATYIYFGYSNRVGSPGAVADYYFGTHSGADGAKSGRIWCGTLYEGGTALSSKYLALSGGTITGGLTVSGSRIVCLPVWNNTCTYATNVYVGNTGMFTRTTTTSSRTIKHDIRELTDNDLRAEKLYDLNVVQFKYNEGIVTDTADVRYGKALPGFIIEDMDIYYPIAIDKPSENVAEWSWNEKYLIPPMLKLIQDQHARQNCDRMEFDERLRSLGGEVKTIHMKYDAALMKIAELEKRIDQLELAS